MTTHGGIQLLPETRKRIEVNVPGENRFFYTGIGIIIAVIAAFVGLKTVTKGLEDQVRAKNREIVRLNESRNRDVEGQLVSLNKQTTLIESFLKNHVFWTQALANIQRAMQQQVKFTILVATLDKQEISFTATAPDYTSIARQLASLVADDGVRDVQITNTKAINNGLYDFNVRVIFDETKYLRK